MRPTTTDQPSTAPEPDADRLPAGPAASAGGETGGAAADPLGERVDALGELLGLSRARISPDALAETGELLERIGERRRLSHEHTVVALAGATGSGKSSLFNALAGLPLSATGLRRPTTARPVSCAWHPERAAGLLDRLGIAPQDRYARRGARIPAPADAPDRAGSGAGADAGGDGTEHAAGGPAAATAGHGGADGIPVGDGGFPAGSGDVVGRAGGDLPAVRAADTAEGGAGLDGLILIDLPDHDSAAPGHRAQVDRLLELVDVVVWVLDPEKYADAALHERYLRPLSGHADVTVLVLNQVDRLPGDAADLVLDDLRRLLDEDGLAVGEHGEAGAVVLAASALTGRGVADLRGVLAQIVAERVAAGRRLAADLDRTAERLHPLYVAEGGAGLTDPAREEFVDRLADAVGAAAAGQAAERDWAAAARDACGTPWGRLRGERTATDEGSRETRTSPVRPNEPGGRAGAVPLVASRPLVGEAVRGLAADAARGLPAPWAQAVRDAARRGGEGLPAALDAAAGRAEPGPPEKPGWWSAARAVQWLLMALAVAGAVCLITLAVGSLHLAWWPPAVMVATGGAGGPLVSAACRAAACGPARRHGQAAERRVRDAAADCGRARVLEPVAAELMRYREVREQFAVVAAAAPVSPRAPHARASRAAVSHSHSSE